MLKKIVLNSFLAAIVALPANLSLGEEAAGTRRLLIVCGHPGDAVYRQEYVRAVDRLASALTMNWGFAPSHCKILFGSAQMHEDGEPLPAHVDAPATSDSLQSAAAQLQAELAPDDALWVVFFGHAYFDGRNTWMNLAGPDIDQTALAKLFEQVRCRECVFWMTTSVSGYFVRPLARADRIVISATEAAPELEATLFGSMFAETVDSPPPMAEFDVDQNGALSLLDLYVTVCRRVAERYAKDQLLATEHAQIDDNGDGRGREVQQYFLPEQLGGRLRPGSKPALRGGQVDGALAATIPLSLRQPANPAAADQAP